MIGALGDILFTVSAKEVRTINNIKWSSTAKYAEQDRHLNDTLLEMVGNEPDEFSFTMYFSVYLGVKPIDEITKLLAAKREGRAMRLVIGTKGYGKNLWVITSVKSTLQNYDNKGNLLVAGANITLKAYGVR